MWDGEASVSMTPRMLRILATTIVLLTLSEALLVHWAAMAFGGGGLGVRGWLVSLAVLGVLNALGFPMARRRLHATGLALFASRSWILGSVAALLTGIMLAALFAVLGGGMLLLESAALKEQVSVWLVWGGGLVVAAGFGSIFWGSSVGNYRVRVDEVELPVPHLSSAHAKLRIVHITDLHIGPLLRPERLRGFVERINRLEPDLVLITGDIFDFDPSYIDAGCRELARLEGRLGVYAVLGNHDIYTGAEEVAKGLERLTSIELLRDEWVHLAVENDLDPGGSAAGLILAGIEDPGKGWTERDSQCRALERIAGEIPADVPCLLLAHRPSYFAYAAELGFPLVLAGHTHGGQVAFPLAKQHNISRLISRWTRGVFHQGESVLYVNRGLGMAGLPLRLNCPREVAVIQLVERVPQTH